MLLASIAHECRDRTSRRAEIPPPEENPGEKSETSFFSNLSVEIEKFACNMISQVGWYPLMGRAER